MQYLYGLRINNRNSVNDREFTWFADIMKTRASHGICNKISKPANVAELSGGFVKSQGEILKF